MESEWILICVLNAFKQFVKTEFGLNVFKDLLTSFLIKSSKEDILSGQHT